MEIAIVGTGYVGLVTGACFADVGVDVTCIDVNKIKIENLKKGILPIYETGLEDLVQRNIQAGRLHFSTDLASCINNVEVIFIAVGTPSDKDGSADLKYVLEVAKTIGENMQKHLLVVTKSTVPVGTARKIRQAIQNVLEERGVSISFDVASNPEFLKEGVAIRDFMSPERVVIGVETKEAEEIFKKLYHPFLLNKFRVIFMDIASAEMTKYAANAMLATRISFMNEIANLCEVVGADVNMVRQGIGSDSRIGNKFLYSGSGYGGSCFPKDVKALIKTASENGKEMQIIEAVERVNETQKTILFEKLHAYYKGELKGRTIALWGLSFKPETDDIREAPSIAIIEKLLQAGCVIKVYDPVAIPETKKKLGNTILYADNMYNATIDADAILLVTEWKEFRILNWTKLKQNMRTLLLIDGRNIYNSKEVEENGFEYLSIGSDK